MIVQAVWLSIVMAGSLCLLVHDTAALGGDHPDCQVGVEAAGWPKGLKELVTRSECVHGFFVNAEDVFFYTGDTDAFRHFLAQYATIQQIPSHRLGLHSGRCQAKSPWTKAGGKPCDWQLQIYPKGWRKAEAHLAEGRAPQIGPDYVVEVHLWRDGNVRVNEVNVPPRVEVFEEVEEGSVPAGDGDSN